MVSSKGYGEWKAKRPYRVWVYNPDGSRFLTHFKNKAEADAWMRRAKMKHKVASKATPRKKRKPGMKRIINMPRF